MKTFAEFIGTKVLMTQTAYNEAYGDVIEGAINVLVYMDGFNIEVLGIDSYQCMISRTCHINKDLNLLESVLWDDFAKWELGITPNEAEEDLHQRAKEFLDKHNFSCSLCEIDLEDGHILSGEDKDTVRYLLNQFDLVNEVRRDRKFDEKIESRSYYILKPNSNGLYDHYVRESFLDKHPKPKKDDMFVMVSKEVHKDNSETVTTVRTFNEMDIVLDIAENRVIWDYTGASTIIWKNKSPHTFDEYNNKFNN